MKEMIRLSLYSHLDAVLAVESKVNALLSTTEDRKEGPCLRREAPPHAYKGR